MADRICIEDHAGCWMHPAKPGHDGIRETASPNGWGDDREVTTARTERLRALYAAMDDAVARYNRAGTDEAVINAAEAMASTWRSIREELGL